MTDGGGVGSSGLLLQGRRGNQTAATRDRNTSHTGDCHKWARLTFKKQHPMPFGRAFDELSWKKNRAWLLEKDRSARGLVAVARPNLSTAPLHLLPFTTTQHNQPASQPLIHPHNSSATPPRPPPPPPSQSPAIRRLPPPPSSTSCRRPLFIVSPVFFVSLSSVALDNCRFVPPSSQ